MLQKAPTTRAYATFQFLQEGALDVGIKTFRLEEFSPRPTSFKQRQSHRVFSEKIVSPFYVRQATTFFFRVT